MPRLKNGRKKGRKKVRPSLAPLDLLQRYTIEETIAYLRSSRKSIYDDIRAGRLRTIQEGRRRYVPGSEIARRSTLDAYTLHKE